MLGVKQTLVHALTCTQTQISITMGGNEPGRLSHRGRGGNFFFFFLLRNPGLPPQPTEAHKESPLQMHSGGADMKWGGAAERNDDIISVTMTQRFTWSPSDHRLEQKLYFLFASWNNKVLFRNYLNKTIKKSKTSLLGVVFLGKPSAEHVTPTAGLFWTPH